MRIIPIYEIPFLQMLRNPIFKLFIIAEACPVCSREDLFLEFRIIVTKVVITVE